MDINSFSRTEFAFPAERAALAVPVFEDDAGSGSPLLQESDARTIIRLRENGALRGTPQEVHYIPSLGDRYDGLLLLGLGKRNDCTTETVRRTLGSAAGLLYTHRVPLLVVNAAPIQEHAAGIVDGLMLGQYRFDQFRERLRGDPVPQAVETLELVVDEKDANLSRRCEQARIGCDCANWARDLANSPSNDMTPSHLAGTALEMAEDAGCRCEVFHRDRLEELGMEAFLGVARGSAEPPTLSVLHYHHEDAATTLALVGKGITFDTGGISLKPGLNMHEMKFDMCGAAAVLGAFRALAALKPAINIVCVVPACENVPGGDAQKPGDVVRACNGKTIEVHNTDAEGRLILADALAYAATNYTPDAMIDVATLTGACVTALGHYAAGLMTPSDTLAASLEAAGEITGERVWRLPLWSDYEKLIEGTHADLCNIGPPKEAGAIVGGMFLKHFAGDTPWAHLDIAGTAWGGKHIPYWDPKHATGYGVRLLTEWTLRRGEASPQ